MDRLAAARARREHQNGTPNEPAHELVGLQNGHNSTAPSGETGNFLSEVAQIQESIDQLHANIKRISELHAKSINAIADDSHRDATELENVSNDTRALSNSIKDRIKHLESQSSTGRDVQLRRNRIALVRQNFLEALQRYQQVEQQSRSKARDRVERQFRIVKPDATPEEVAAVVNNSSGQGDQIFADALTSSTRYGDSRMAYREVQERHQEILRMTQTLAELGQLFNDMATLVEQQDVTIGIIEDTSRKVEEDAKAGDEQVAIAVKHARNARRMRWIFFGICVFIVAVLALALGLHFGLK
ncbi:hypothetical protein ONZ45_g16356 [Pleurotus djamor]|nr:hypothetical protein ONZ45_g16356 [Pleurotus djamor]